ncbi:MAG: ABC transporter ATP-binding protein [Propionibacteriaceae bacterium]|jgi:ABC-type multidrug transport system ATPase subunit|nr:ABC transporter ATP-binding protein [Propionibacteriaceae bacterium]
MVPPRGSNSAALLSAEHVSKRYSNDVLALDDFCLTINPGEIVGLIGPNGAGKSTVLNVLGGFLHPTGGTVTTATNRIGWCPQQTVVDWSLTALENAVLVARLFGANRRQALAQAEQALDLLGLHAVATTQAEELSGGQLQRIQIARAICFNASLLLLDEPTTGLDVEGQIALWTYLNVRRDAGVGILVSSHDLDALERSCDRFLILRHGHIVMTSSVAQLTGSDDEATTLRQAYLSTGEEDR